ncbi:MAG: hypothetical protein KGZ87_08290 [Bacteroidetes bacterium]|nr:hypothetical protein [Bacteroidota bacterium]
MTKAHSFHIPVMGIGFTVDTPLKVSHYGIDSVISLVDDILFEKMRKMYSEKFQLPYQEISDKIDDFRAKRITAYLNLVSNQVEKKFQELKNIQSEISHELHHYFDMLPDYSTIKKEFIRFKEQHINFEEFKLWIQKNLMQGSIDVNIMTKLDKVNFSKGVSLPTEFNDAHAALRGFANSNLNSSIVFSAGMNPRLYSYIEQFSDFYPSSDGMIKKKIILKVSDYRSAIIQGKFLAKKGLWVSEYRIESGLNCGGHAFATDGYLMGPILAEFRDKREELINTTYEILVATLQSKNLVVPKETLALKITAQGGVGTAEEHEFLLNHYKLDAVGWGSPFLLVPEATNVDELTMEKLINATEDDLYLSNISPLGVPFNSLKGNSKDAEKLNWIAQGKPGSPCPKKYLISNTEFTEKAICSASRKYQLLKIEELDALKLDKETYDTKFDQITDKSCICVGLGTSALINNNINTKIEGTGVSVCPGPNIAYFSKSTSLKEMVHHIYGKVNVISRNDRPHVFVKELTAYLDYLKSKIDETTEELNSAQSKYLNTFMANLNEGITYYTNLFNELKGSFENTKATILDDIEQSLLKLNQYKMQVNRL